MITIEECRSLAKQRLSAPRYQHTLNVSDLAVRLARFYGADETKAEIAALLHDVCKERPRAELLQMLRDNAIMTQNAAAKPQGASPSHARQTRAEGKANKVRSCAALHASP